MGIKGRVLRSVFTLGAAVFAGILLAPKPGKETRRELKVTANKVKKEVAKKLAKVQVITKAAYEETVADVLAYYAKAEKLTRAEVNELNRDLKARWQDVLVVLKEKPAKKKKAVPRRGVAKKPAKKSRKR